MPDDIPLRLPEPVNDIDENAVGMTQRNETSHRSQPIDPSEVNPIELYKQPDAYKDNYTGTSQKAAGEETFVPQDSTAEFRYSLWTDLSGEQTEFLDAMEQFSHYQLIKVNVFPLFDFSTIGNKMIQI